jgi:hypothetical protein
VIDAFLVFFLVTLVPIAFLGVGGRTEHVLFVGWRWLQVVTLFGAGAYILYRLIRYDWRGLLVLVLVAAGVAWLGLSYIGIAWDAQIEYNRVLQLARQYGSITDAYRHGVTHWILGYPPGASLSVAFFLTLKLISPNVAQGILLILWSGNMLARHMRHIDLPGKLAFFLLLATGEQLIWHYTYFYNNLAYALVWATFVLVPLFGSSLRPWEWCGYALVLVWLRPQWQIAAIPITLGALATLASARVWSWKVLRDTALLCCAALLVAQQASTYWKSATIELDAAIAHENRAVIDSLTAQQNAPVLDVVVPTEPTVQQATPLPELWSRESVDAVKWAYHVTDRLYALSLGVLAGALLIALVVLRRRGLVFLVPLLSPLGVLVGTAYFAHVYAGYRANTWALERLQIIVPILAAGTLAALHHALRTEPRR